MENQGKESGRPQQHQQGQPQRSEQAQQQAQQADQAQASGQQARRGAGIGPRPVDGGQILERGRAVLNDARGLASTLEEAFDEIQGYLREQLEQRPYATLAAASGIGYILGGGLPSRLTGLLFGWGSRVALTMVVQQLAPQMSRATPQSASPQTGGQ